MATSKLCIATILVLSFQASYSYILLTANVDDVHAIAKQIAASPVASQLNQILRRASNIFNQQFSKPQQPELQPQLRSFPSLDVPDRAAGRAQGSPQGSSSDGSDNSDIEVWKPYSKDPELQNAGLSGSEVSDISSENDHKENRVIERRHKVGPDLVDLGRNASFYLTSIKKIFENI